MIGHKHSHAKGKPVHKRSHLRGKPIVCTYLCTAYDTSTNSRPGSTVDYFTSKIKRICCARRIRKISLLKLTQEELLQRLPRLTMYQE